MHGFDHGRQIIDVQSIHRCHVSNLRRDRPIQLIVIQCSMKEKRETWHVRVHWTNFNPCDMQININNTRGLRCAAVQFPLELVHLIDSKTMLYHPSHEGCHSCPKRDPPSFKQIALYFVKERWCHEQEELMRIQSMCTNMLSSPSTFPNSGGICPESLLENTMLQDM